MEGASARRWGGHRGCAEFILGHCEDRCAHLCPCEPVGVPGLSRALLKSPWLILACPGAHWALGTGCWQEAKRTLLSAFVKAVLWKNNRQPTGTLGEQRRTDMTMEKFGDANLKQQFLFLIYLSWLTEGKQRAYQGHTASLSLSLSLSNLLPRLGFRNKWFFFSSKWIKLSGDGW